MRFLSSLLLRLTLLYALLFSASLAALLGGYYLVSIYAPTNAVQYAIRTEADALLSRYGMSVSAELGDALKQRTPTTDGRIPYHVLLSKDGKLVTTNLPSWPDFSGDGWYTIEADTYYKGVDSDHRALLLDLRLEDGGRLLIGRDIEDLKAREETLFGAVQWLLFGGVLFGLLAGAFMSRAVGHRIESINRTARRVMSGNLFERIPTYGSGDDFDRLAETLNLMLDRIQVLLTSIRRVSDSVAHELRTPLTRLHADLSELEGALPPASRPLLNDAIVEADKVIGLFDAVLRIGRIESIHGHLDMAPIDLSGLLADVAEIFGPSAEAKSVTLEILVPPGLSVRGDRNLIFQALGNVLDNAIKYAPVGSTVQLLAEEASGRVRVHVIDNGPGISREQRQAVFERFVRLPETSGIPGLGLGLSFAKAVADAHGAWIELEDAGPGLKVVWSFDARDGAG